MCMYFSTPSQVMEFCLDSGSPVSLISEECRLAFFQDIPVYPIPHGKWLRCEGIGTGELLSRYCISISLNLHTEAGRSVTVSGEVHVVPR